jgi:hypothetical protein
LIVLPLRKKSATTKPLVIVFLCLQNRVAVRRVVPADDDDEEEDDDDIDETLTERLIGNGYLKGLSHEMDSVFDDTYG